MNLGYPSYDNNGNIQAIQNLLEPAKHRSFTYDALDRLGTATGPWGSLGWTYDGVGNRQTENANTYTYAPNTNKLTSANGISFGYDNNGNTTIQSSRVYTYNQNQRLIQVVDGAMTAGYTYNGNGQRVKKNVNGTVTVFHYSLNGQIIAESNSAGTITAEYVYLNGQPLAKMEGANTYYYHNDHLATPQKLTDSTGTVVWSADYKPFGEATVTVSTITNNLRFPGQYYDAETGLNYNYMRDYDAAIGRYKQADPIGQLGGINPFLYAGSNPISWIDPFGLYQIIVADPGGRNGQTYGGTMMVIGNNGQVVVVNVSSWPNPNDPAPGIATGTYPSIYSTTGHHSVTNGVRLANGDPIPTLDPNPVQNGQSNATGVNIHCGFSPTSRGSQNCITIQPNQCQQVWNILQTSQTGPVTVSRSSLMQFWIWLRSRF
jgi:RHS repeat-associated protein